MHLAAAGIQRDKAISLNVKNVKFRRVLERDFPDYKLERLTTAADLERSFGPVYARGVLRRGTAASRTRMVLRRWALAPR